MCEVGIAIHSERKVQWGKVADPKSPSSRGCDRAGNHTQVCLPLQAYTLEHHAAAQVKSLLSPVIES